MGAASLPDGSCSGPGSARPARPDDSKPSGVEADDGGGGSRAPKGGPPGLKKMTFALLAGWLGRRTGPPP